MMRAKAIGAVLPFVVAASLFLGACGEEDDTDVPQAPGTTDTTQQSDDSVPSAPGDY